MADRAREATRMLAEQMHRTRDNLAWRTATVTAVSLGMVQVQFPEADEPGTEYYAGVAGFDLAVGDTVALAPFSGTYLVVGRIQAAAPAEVLFPGRLLVRHASASAATVTSNASLTVYETSLAATWSDIPDGTYDLIIDFSLTESHSGSGSVHNRLTVAGVADSELSLSITTARERIGYTRGFTGVVITTGLTVTMAYKLNGGSGTISARNPKMTAFLTYTGP